MNSYDQDSHFNPQTVSPRAERCPFTYAVLDDMHERAMHSYAARYVHGDEHGLTICNVRSRMLGLRDLQRLTWFPERKDAARLECFKLFHFMVVQSEAAQVKIGSHPIRPCGLG